MAFNKNSNHFVDKIIKIEKKLILIVIKKWI